jgi:hypothetical protein
VALDTLLPDQPFFDALRKSTNAQLRFDIAQYWAANQPSGRPDLDAQLLALLNDRQTTAAVLDQTIGINSKAASAIINHRDGPDHTPGTSDDDLFETVAELDNVPFVGESTLSILRSHAATHSR